MIEINNVTKIYKMKENEVKALDSVNLSFPNTGLVVLLGPSGSGKTTLLNILGGIDNATEGTISYNGSIINNINVCEYRRNICSFVFQEYNLLSNLNVRDNISLITDCNNKDKEKLVSDILEKIGLSGYEKRNINELSGGQKQRIAIGRALVKGSKVLLCDEPTGNLDSKCSEEIFELLKKISKEKLVIVVSHNEEMANKYASRIISIKDGSIINDKLLLEHDSDISTNNGIVKNKITLNAMLKYGIRSIKAKKIKTIISILLLVLNFFSMCLMTSCLTYSSEEINARLSKNSDIEYVVKDSGNSLQPRNFNYRLNATITSYLPLFDVETIVSNENRMDGYEIQDSAFYIVDDNNMEILNNFSYYFREPLTIGACYITDYYLDIVINKEYNYNHIMYSKYEDVKNQPVYFNDKLQYIIAGIIETDYKRFYDNDGNEIKSDEIYNYHGYYASEICHKANLEYKVIYEFKETFNNMTYSKDYYYFSNNYNSYKIDTETVLLDGDDNSVYFETNIDDMSFFLNNGYYGSFDKEDLYTKKIPYDEDSIIISINLYERLFGLDFVFNDFFSIDYETAIMNEKPMDNLFPHIGERISITITNKKTNAIIELKDKKIVGVKEFSLDKDNSFYIYNKDINYDNIDICNRYVSIISFKNISINQTIKELRNNDILLSKAKYYYAYSFEYIFVTMMVFFLISTFILFILTICIILNMIIHRINDNRKEIGILYAEGCNKKEIFIMYFTPIIFITVISAILALIMFIIGCNITNSFLNIACIGYIELIYLKWQIIIMVIFMVVLIFLISSLPLVKHMKKSPKEIIN